MYTTGVVANLSDAAQNTGEAAGDTYKSIEGLTGSAYSDRLIGNEGANQLNGRWGNDTLEGGAGDDTLDGSSGSDVLRGGAGYDFASYYHAAGDVVANLSNASENRNEAFGDVYDSIEALSGSAYNDTLTGNWDGNNLHGHAGDDRLAGLAGRDYLLGGAGFDLAGYTTAVTANLLDSTQNTGEAAGDTYEGIEGLAGSNYADHLTGDHADNVIYGGYGSDTLFGLSGNDRLYAGGDNDDLIGGSGADTLDGGDGFDYASYYTAGTGVRASLTSNWLNTGDAAWDVYVSIEGLGGSNYADWLSGNEAANVLHGHGGNDELLGGGGFDELFGGEGWDVLHGGTGADVLDGGAGHDFASYLYATAGVTANLSESWRNQGEAYGDTYVSIEGLAGS
ncbi:calcium-binding protein, partial [Microvirga sp. BSC39]|uniref:calcium-binding protein n=1 Tax=Microvirga sp. BSC39 TaxID=1549810 RepID=UPI00244DE3D3